MTLTLTPIQVKAKFLALACELSPENLTCDGELSSIQVKVKHNNIMKQWRALEKDLKRKVTEDEAWSWSKEVRAWEQAQLDKELAKEPNHPLLQHKSRGVWRRLGKNNCPAYYILGPTRHGKKGYHVYSEFSDVFNHREKLGEWPTFNEAVSMAERFLKTVNKDELKRAHPEWNDKHIEHYLGYLPEEETT